MVKHQVVPLCGKTWPQPGNWGGIMSPTSHHFQWFMGDSATYPHSSGLGRVGLQSLQHPLTRGTAGDPLSYKPWLLPGHLGRKHLSCPSSNFPLAEALDLGGAIPQSRGVNARGTWWAVTYTETRHPLRPCCPVVGRVPSGQPLVGSCRTQVTVTQGTGQPTMVTHHVVWSPGQLTPPWAA